MNLTQDREHFPDKSHSRQPLLSKLRSCQAACPAAGANRGHGQLAVARLELIGAAVHIWGVSGEGGSVRTISVAERCRTQYSFWKHLRLPRLQEAKSHPSLSTVDRFVLVSWQHRRMSITEPVDSEDQAIPRQKGSRTQDRSGEP